MNPSLTPSLNEEQLRANIDALQKGGLPNDKVQAYVNNYARNPAGGYMLKSQPSQAPQTAAQTASPDLLSKASDAVGSIFPGKAIGQDIGTLGGYIAAKIKDYFSGTDTAKHYDLSAPSPLQATGDALKGAALVGGLGAAAPETLGGAALSGAGYGALAGAGQGASTNDLGNTVKGAGVGALTGAATGAATFGIGRLISSLGDKITNSVIRPSQADIKDGFDVSTIQKHDLGGSLSTMYDKTESKLSDLSAQLNNKLGASGSTVDLNDVYQQTADSLSKNKLKGFGSNTSIDGALEQLQGEIQALQKPDVSIPEAQVVKQATGKMGAWQYGVRDPSATARETVYNAFYSNLKNAIEQNSPEGVRDINKQISELIPVQNAIIRRIPIADRNSALSLSDMVSLVGSAINPHALAGLGISLAQKSGAVANLLSKYVSPAVEKAAVPLATGAASLGSGVATGGGNTQ